MGISHPCPAQAPGAAAADATLAASLRVFAVRDAEAAVARAQREGPPGSDAYAADLADENRPCHALLATLGHVALLEADLGDRVAVKHSVVCAGLGAFATARVPRDAFVGVYEGEALDAAAFSARYADARPDCVFQVHGDLFVDAARSAHFSRFLNHAARGTRPANLAAHATAPHGGFRGAALVVCFYATRDVAPGRAVFDRRFGRSRPNFSMLQLGHIGVDSADFWTNRSLSSSSRSPAEEAASKLSRTLTLKSS